MLSCARHSLSMALIGAFTLATAAMLATTIAASATEAYAFLVPPTGDPAADLAAIKAAVANAKTWQADQPKGADGLAAKVEVVLAPGTYNLCPAGASTPAPPGGDVGGQYCLQFSNWENLVFRGTRNRTRIVLLDPDEGYIDFFRSRHVTVADLTLDMKTAPFTQGRVAAVHLNGVNLASLDVQLDQGFQTFADPIYQFEDPNFLVIMDPVVARPKPTVPNFMRVTFTPPPYSGGTFAWGVLLPDGKTWRLTFEPTASPPWRFTDPLDPPIVPGDRFVFVTRRPNSGIVATFCDTVTLAHVTIHAAGGITFVQNTGPLLLDDLDIKIPEGGPRLISTNLGGANLQNNRGPVTVQYSSFQGMADDAIATYSLATTIHQVTASGANGKVVDYSPRAIQQGDRLQILDATDGAIRGIATVTQAQAFKCPAGMVSVMCFNLTLDAVPAGTMAADIAYLYNAAGNGASIHHNVFHAHRGNGILLFASDSIVADNEFTEVPNNGITIGPYHADFNQGPVPDRVVVQRNSFHGGDIGSIDMLVTSVIPKSGVRGNQTNAVDGPSHIVITDNRFRNPAYPAIDVEIGDHIHLSNDRIASDVASTGAPAPAVRLVAGSGITVRDLAVRTTGGVTAAVEIGCGVTDVNASRWTIRSGAVPPILDLRPQCQ